MPASRASASSATHAALSLAGALVWRRGARGLELALAQRGGRWGLPRTGVGPDEERGAAALRLAEDWTGAGAEALGFAGTARAEVDDRTLSTWYFHLRAGPLPGSARPWVRWCSLEDALARLEDEDERVLLGSVRPPALADAQGVPRTDAAWTPALVGLLTGLAALELPFAASRPWLEGLRPLLHGSLAAGLVGCWGVARWLERRPAPLGRTLAVGAAAAALATSVVAEAAPVVAPLAGALAAWVVSERAVDRPRA